MGVVSHPCGAIFCPACDAIAAAAAVAVASSRRGVFVGLAWLGLANQEKARPVKSG